MEKFDGYFPYARWNGVFPSKDGWYFYYYQEHHGRHVFKVDKQSLLLQTSEVFSLLDKEIYVTAQEYVSEEALHIKNQRRKDCLEIGKSLEWSGEKFIEEISSKSVNEEEWVGEVESFNLQWEKGKLYWASVLFEAIFLSLWWLFSFHSGVFGRFNRSLSVRLAFSPLLLFVPHFLGYVPYLFSFGASGGILYPAFAMLLSLPFSWIPVNSIEMELLGGLPQPLQYISPVPFSPMAMSFMGAVSPTGLCVFAVLVLGGGKVITWYFAKGKT